MENKTFNSDTDAVRMNDKQIMNWAFDELRKRFRTQSKKYYKLAESALQMEDKDSYSTFLAVAHTYKRAVEEVVAIDIRTICIRDERDAADDENYDMGN